MAFYVQQGLIDLVSLKAGFAESWRLMKRQTEHETRGGPQLQIAIAPNWTREDEAAFLHAVHEFRAWGDERERPYEVFFFAPPVVDILCSKEWAERGLCLRRKPIDPNAETCREWQKRVSRLRRGAFAGRAAAANIDADTRLRGLVNPDHHGGWTMADSVAGKMGWVPRTQTVSGKQAHFFERLGLTPTIYEEGRHLICELRAKGRTFKFFVFAEAQDRAGMKRHPQALVAGVPWGKPVLPGTPRVPVKRRADIVPALPGQGVLFGDHS